MFYFVFFLKFWLPIGLRSGCCCNNFNNVPTVAAVSAQRPVEHFKKALQNITTDRTPHSVNVQNVVPQMIKMATKIAKGLKFDEIRN